MRGSRFQYLIILLGAVTLAGVSCPFSNQPARKPPVPVAPVVEMQEEVVDQDTRIEGEWVLVRQTIAGAENSFSGRELTINFDGSFSEDYSSEHSDTYPDCMVVGENRGELIFTRVKWNN